jgi:predicted Zn-dependent protease
MRAYHAFSSATSAEAVQLLRQAVARAPDDPTILAGYALALVRGVALASDAAAFPDDPLVIAKRAVDLAPVLTDTRVALASMFVHVGEYGRAAKELRAGLELGSSSAEANALLGRLLCECGLPTDGIRRLAAARTLDPRIHVARADEARALWALGSRDECDALLASAVATDATQAAMWFLMRVRYARWSGSDMGAMRDAIRGTLFESAPHVTALLRFMEGGELEQDFLEWLRTFVSDRHVSLRRKALAAQLMTEMYCVAGRSEDAFEQLERADRVLLLDLAWLEICPVLAPLRGSRRFAEVRSHVAARASTVLRVLGWDERPTC